MIKILQIQNPELSALPTLSYTDTMARERYMTLAEACNALGVHRNTIPSLVKRGLLTGDYFSGRWLLDRAVVEELAKTYVPKKGPAPRIRRRRSNALPDSVLAQIEAQSDWDNKVGS